MTTITTRGEIGADQKLRLAVDGDLPPGPVEVSLTVRSREAPGPSPSWADLWGLGRDVWLGVDAARYVTDQREDRGPPR